MPEPKVTGLHPKVADAFSKMMAEAKVRGMSPALSMGLRTAEQQEILFAQGRTLAGPIVTQARGWESWHNYGLAVDIAFRNEKGNLFWPPDDSSWWKDLGSVGKMFGFEWGGEWKGFKDRPHFQMRPYVFGKPMLVKEAKELAFAEGIDALWKLV